MNIGGSSCSSDSSAASSLLEEKGSSFPNDDQKSSTGGGCVQQQDTVENGAQQKINTSSGSSNGSVEIEAAVTFMADVMKAARFEDESTENFKQALIGLLMQHYEGHWYPNDPFKGSGYRCLRVNGVMNPLLTKAAQLSGLPIKKFRHAFPVELTVWVDPGDVSVRFGEEGSIGVYYAKSGQGLRHDHQEMEELKKLVALAPKRSVTPPASFQSDLFAINRSPMGCGAAALGGSMSNRNSPASMLAGSPPSTSFYSSLDAKAMSINAAHMYSTSAMLRNQSPLRKFHQQANGVVNNSMLHQQQQMFGRRTPDSAVPYLYHQQQQPLSNSNMHQHNNSFASMTAQQGHFYGADLNRGDANSASAAQYPSPLEMIDFETSRRTPPNNGSSAPQPPCFDLFPSAIGGGNSSQHRLYESATQRTPLSDSWASSVDNYPGHQQFYGGNQPNYGGGSPSQSWGMVGQSRGTSPPSTVGRFGRLRETVGVVN